MAEFQFTEAEFVRGCRQLARKTLVTFWVCIVLFVALFGAFMASRGRSLEASAVGAGTILCVMAAVSYFSRRRRYHKLFREQSSLREKMELAVDDDGMHLLWSRGAVVVPWSEIRRWKETPEFFFLFESTMSARMLPKRALSEEEVAVIRRHIATIKKA